MVIEITIPAVASSEPAFDVDGLTLLRSGTTAGGFAFAVRANLTLVDQVKVAKMARTLEQVRRAARRAENMRALT